MNQTHRTARRAPLAALVALLLASLLLAACGGSSPTTASSAAAKTPAATRAARSKAVRECLAKSGITLPERGTGASGTPPAGRPPGGFGLGGTGGPKLPAGVSREQFQSALRKCGGGLGNGFRGARLSSPRYREGLVKFSSCMAENGVKLPAPNTTGKGPIFDTRGIDVNTAKFRAAQQKCSSLLRFGPGAGPGGQPGTPGGP